ncbi:MAG TPA: hypothetical protein VGC22_03915 [Chitinophaga sp.]
MKSIKLLALLFVLSIAGAQAQTADELIGKYVTAMGGADKLKALKTAYNEGSVEVQGMEFPLKVWKIQSEAMRMEFDAMGTTNIQVVTKNGGWSLMPVQGQTAPTALDSSRAKMMESQLSINGELYDYKANGKKVELLGKEAVDGVDAYKLKVTSKDGVEGIAYLDAATYYLIRTENHVTVPGQDAPVDIIVKMSDYKKTDDGYVYPSVTEQPASGVKVLITKAEYNKPVDDSLFKMPAAK